MLCIPYILVVLVITMATVIAKKNPKLEAEKIHICFKLMDGN